MVNIKKYDSLVHGGENVSNQEIMALEGSFEAALPTIFKAGLFDLFPPAEWIAGSRRSPGKARVGEMALDYLRKNQSVK